MRFREAEIPAPAPALRDAGFPDSRRSEQGGSSRALPPRNPGMRLPKSRSLTCKAKFYAFWQCGHHTVERPATEAEASFFPHTRHVSPALPYTKKRFWKAPTSPFAVR